MNRPWKNFLLTWLRSLGWTVVDIVTNLVTIPTLDGRTFRQKMSLFMTVFAVF
jgi:rhamnogalacturonyl hydrolase YesR